MRAGHYCGVGGQAFRDGKICISNDYLNDTRSLAWRRGAADAHIGAAAAIRTDCLVRVTGSDIDENILVSARANAERACVTAGRALQEIGNDARIPRPDFARASFDELAAPYDSGLLLSNPPYGERLGDRESASALYSSMHALLRNFPGWDLGFITSHDGFEEAFGKKASKKRALKSGNLDADVTNMAVGSSTVVTMGAYDSLGKHDEAIDQLKQCSLSDESLEISRLSGIACAYEAKGMHREAAEYFEKAATRNSKDVNAAENLNNAARNFGQAGEKETALELYRNLKKTYPSTPVSRDADREIAALSH